MNIILAESAGFCFGVKRAVEMVYEQAGSGRPVYTYGPIIHNEEVVRDLEERGVRVAERIEEFAGLPKGTVVIRAHGVERGVSGGRHLPVRKKNPPSGGEQKQGGKPDCDRGRRDAPGGPRDKKLVRCGGDICHL